MHCPKCGAYNEETSKFCTKCGQPLARVTPSVPTATKRRGRGLLTVALIIMVVLLILDASWVGFRWYQNHRAEQRVGLAKPTPTPEPTARLEPTSTSKPTARPELTPTPEPTPTPIPEALHLKLGEVATTDKWALVITNFEAEPVRDSFSGETSIHYSITYLLKNMGTSPKLWDLSGLPIRLLDKDGYTLPSSGGITPARICVFIPPKMVIKDEAAGAVQGGDTPLGTLEIPETIMGTKVTFDLTASVPPAPLSSEEEMNTIGDVVTFRNLQIEVLAASARELDLGLENTGAGPIHLEWNEFFWSYFNLSSSDPYGQKMFRLVANPEGELCIVSDSDLPASIASGNKVRGKIRVPSCRFPSGGDANRLLLFDAFGNAAVFSLTGQHVVKPAEPVAIVGEVPIRTDTYQKIVRYYRSNLKNQLAMLQDQLARLDPDDQSTEFIAQYYQQQIEQLQSQLGDSETLGQQVLDDLIDDELIHQEAVRRGIAVTPEEVQLEIETQFGYERNPPTPIPAPITTTLTITPTPTVAPMTLDRFQELYATTLEALAERVGFSEADFRRVFEAMLLRRKLQETMGEEVPTIADQVHARQIQVKNEEQAQAILTLLEKDTDEASALDALRLLLAEEGEVKTEEEIRAEKDPQKLLTQLRESDDPFALLAQNFSKDAGNKDKGGNLGWFSKGRMVPEFEGVAFSTPPGEIGEPVETQFGWHIISIEETAQEPEPQVRASHILVDTEAEAQAIVTLLEEDVDEDTILSALDVLIEAEVARARAKEEEAQELLTQLREDDDPFALLAQNFSDDIRSKDKGGDMDWFPTGEMTPEFEEIAFSLEVGEISKPISNAIGYHVIQVLGHEERELAPQILEQRKVQALEDWLEEQRRSEAVKLYWSLAKVPPDAETGR